MIDDERGSFVNKNNIRLLITGSLLTLLAAGCTDVRRAVGIDRSMPDEFAVESRAPLTLPPDFDLRPPQPGAARPQEAPISEKARKVIDNAGPGEPGKQAMPALKAPQGGLGKEGEQTPDQSLSNKLLGYQDTGAGAAVEKRETTTLKNVY